MDVGNLVLDGAGRTRLGHRAALRHKFVALHKERPEMGQRDLVTIRGEDGDREPARRNLPGECNLAGDGGTNHSSAAESDVDTSVLSARIGVVAERELTEDVAVRRPGPSLGARRGGERPRGR
ncbi:MAG: hypothetical protein M3435_05955 [Actinomycetota bacterium]|nr:hypothetical protein [Actinomycetota bacterium]